MFTILFGVSEFLPKNQMIAAAVMVVAMAALPIIATIVGTVVSGLAILATIPATKAINNGQHIKMIVASVIFSVIGLFVIGFAGNMIGLLLPGIILAGVGYVLIMQTTTAWNKNLYPEGSFGQFEGVRIIFHVMIPMVLGPSTANIVIQNFGTQVVINGNEGMAPSAMPFFVTGIMSMLTLVPTYLASKQQSR